MATQTFINFSHKIPRQPDPHKVAQTDMWEYIYTHHHNMIPEHTRTKISLNIAVGNPKFKGVGRATQAMTIRFYESQKGNK